MKNRAQHNNDEKLNEHLNEQIFPIPTNSGAFERTWANESERDGRVGCYFRWKVGLLLWLPVAILANATSWFFWFDFARICRNWPSQTISARTLKIEQLQRIDQLVAANLITAWAWIFHLRAAVVFLSFLFLTELSSIAVPLATLTFPLSTDKKKTAKKERRLGPLRLAR